MKKVQKPWSVRIDVGNCDEDALHGNVHCERAAPYLFLYFNAAFAFEGGIICADGHKFKVLTCVSNAILSYISIFHVFQVGFNESVFNFLATLEHLLLGAPFKPAKYVPVKMDEFLTAIKGKMPNLPVSK